MKPGFWLLHPTWHNYSSMYREAVTAVEAPTDMERSHHRTASLYFGIAALEAFLNEKWRDYRKNTQTDEQILKELRGAYFKDKLKKWGSEIVGAPTLPAQDIVDLILDANDVRGHLTHIKTRGPELYERLFSIDPMTFVDAIARYLVSYYEAAKDQYPYWIFGWNYLNPRPNEHEIILINSQQFCHSLNGLGFNVPSYDPNKSEQWRALFLGTTTGYEGLKDALARCADCEQKFTQFPFQPKLCRRWWSAEHQAVCGRVTRQAIDAAIELDRRPRAR